MSTTPPEQTAVQDPPEPRASHRTQPELFDASFKPQSGQGSSQQESDETASFENPSKYGSDLSTYDRWNNLRVWAGEFASVLDVQLVLTAT